MDNFLEYPNDKYSGGIELDEYNGEISLVRARRAEDGTVYKDWCFPAIKKEPGKKSLPWKIKIGNSTEEACETLRHFLGLLGDNPESAPGYSGPPLPGATDDDIPF